MVELTFFVFVCQSLKAADSKKKVRMRMKYSSYHQTNFAKLTMSVLVFLYFLFYYHFILNRPSYPAIELAPTRS